MRQRRRGSAKPKSARDPGRLKSAAIITVAIAAVLSLGTAVADKMITGRDIKNGSLTGKDIRKHTITGRHIKKHSIPLSALKSVPAGKKGEPGPKGDPGSPGLIGATGETGPTAFAGAYTIGSTITSTAPSTNYRFLGEAAVFEVLPGDRGSITVTAVIGTTEGPIAGGQPDFRVTICYDAAGEVLPLDGVDEEGEPVEPEEIGISPTIQDHVRTSVPVSSGFFVTGEEGEPFSVELGPCVLNETASTLDFNDRVVGSILVAGM